MRKFKQSKNYANNAPKDLKVLYGIDFNLSIKRNLKCKIFAIIYPMKKAKKQKTILFDLDGTLIDGTQAILEAFEVALQGTQTHFDDERIKAMIGFPLDIMFANLGFVGEQITERIAAYKAHYLQIYLAQTTLLPRVKEALSKARDFADLAVVTTKGTASSKAILRNLGVLHLFGAVVGRDDVSEPKPSAEPILKALTLLDKGKTDAFMVGDTHLDIKAAQNAKISPIAITCGYESEQNLAKYGVLLKANAYEAVEFIKNL